MDPWLETHWGDVHHRLIQYACDALQLGLPQDLLARVEERVFVETDPGALRVIVPDVHVAYQRSEPDSGMMLHEGGVGIARPQIFEILTEPTTEGYIEIRQREGGKVVTVIEFLSPANKSGGVGQQKYLEKQFEVLGSDASLVEIDLVRAGRRVLALPANRIPIQNERDYLACISPGWRRNRRELYVMALRQRLPVLPVPLRQSEPRAKLDLQSLLDQAYEAGRYDTLNYARELDPPLPAAEAAWATEVLKERAKP